MTFCHNCGTQLPDTTTFCTSCGTRRISPETPGSPATPATPAQTMPTTQPQTAPSANERGTGQPQGGLTPPVHGGPWPGQPSVAPAAPVAQPAGGWQRAAATASSTEPAWAGAPAAVAPSLDQLWQRYGGDWARALIAVLLLLMSLGLKWNNKDFSADNVPALLAIIAALPIGFVDLLLRPALTGRVFAADQRLLFRALLSVPLAGVAVWAFIDNIAHGSGFGPGIGLALTGAAVAVTGAGTTSEAGHTRLWLTAAAASLTVSMLWIAWALVQALKSAADLSSIGGGVGGYWLLEAAAICALLWMAWLTGWFAQLAFTGSPKVVPIACWLAACLGTWLVLARLFTAAFGSPYFDSVMNGALTFLTVGVALLTASSIRKARPHQAAFNWMTAAHSGLLILGTAHALSALSIALTLSQRPPSTKAPWIWLLVLQLAGLGGAFVTRSALGRDPKAGRIPVLVYAAAFTIMFWLTYLIADSIFVSTYALGEAVLMVGPAAVAFCLLVPPTVRQLLGPVALPAAFQGARPDPAFPGTAPAPAQPPTPGTQTRWQPPASPSQPPTQG